MPKKYQRSTKEIKKAHWSYTGVTPKAPRSRTWQRYLSSFCASCVTKSKWKSSVTASMRGLRQGLRHKIFVAIRWFVFFLRIILFSYGARFRKICIFAPDLDESCLNDARKAFVKGHSWNLPNFNLIEDHDTDAFCLFDIVSASGREHIDSMG